MFLSRSTFQHWAIFQLYIPTTTIEVLVKCATYNANITRANIIFNKQLQSDWVLNKHTELCFQTHTQPYRISFCNNCWLNTPHINKQTERNDLDNFTLKTSSRTWKSTSHISSEKKKRHLANQSLGLSKHRRIQRQSNEDGRRQRCGCPNGGCLLAAFEHRSRIGDWQTMWRPGVWAVGLLFATSRTMRTVSFGVRCNEWPLRSPDMQCELRE